MRAHLRLPVVALVMCAVLAAAVYWHRETDPGPYVALGDSFTAAPGVPETTTDCQRSDHNYPALVAEGLRLASLQDLSCTGATVGDLVTSQVPALSADTRLVTVGIGGNDIGFGDLVKHCLTLGLSFLAASGVLGVPSQSPCHDAYTRDGTDLIAARIQQAGDRLAAALAEIRHQAPRARTLVVGYPAILPRDSTTCSDELPLAPSDISYLRGEAERLNDMLRQRARAAGAEFVDTYAPSPAAGVCAEAGSRWVEPLVPTRAAMPMHPNGTGEQGMAQAVLKVLNADR